MKREQGLFDRHHYRQKPELRINMDIVILNEFSPFASLYTHIPTSAKYLNSAANNGNEKKEKKERKKKQDMQHKLA